MKETIEEYIINALTLPDQMRMARLVLAGWKIEFKTTAHHPYWMAHKDGRGIGYSNQSLAWLLLKIDEVQNAAPFKDPFVKALWESADREMEYKRRLDRAYQEASGLPRD